MIGVSRFIRCGKLCEWLKFRARNVPAEAGGGASRVLRRVQYDLMPREALKMKRGSHGTLGFEFSNNDSLLLAGCDRVQGKWRKRPVVDTHYGARQFSALLPEFHQISRSMRIYWLFINYYLFSCKFPYTLKENSHLDRKTESRKAGANQNSRWWSGGSR